MFSIPRLHVGYRAGQQSSQTFQPDLPRQKLLSIDWSLYNIVQPNGGKKPQPR